MTKTRRMAGICLGIVAAAALFFPGLPAKTAAHEMHGDGSVMHMQRQHQTMDDIQKEWLAAREAAERENPEEALSAASRMGDAAKGLDGFMLHKNPDRRDEFLKKAEGFKKLIARFERYARRGDTGPLKSLVPGIDKACEDCHQAFR